MIFQMMFAVITVALITGAVVERVKFSAIVVFSILWFTLVYCPVAHWVWGGGWLAKLGALDFAGGMVVHITAGVSAFAMAFLLGPRKGYHDGAPMSAHNVPLVVIGAGLLWFGWFGFNAGSALTSGGLAASTFVTTNMSGGCRSFNLDDIELVFQPAYCHRNCYRSRSRAGSGDSGFRLYFTYVGHCHRSDCSRYCFLFHANSESQDQS